MLEKAVCTVVTKNHLSYARSLSKSVGKHNENIRILVLLADRVEGCFDPKSEPFELITIDELTDDSNEKKIIRRMCFYYTPFELCNALRARLHEYILKKTSIDKWLYLDSDIMIFGSLEPIYEQLNKCSILLSPHSRTPVEENIAQAEIPLLCGGVFNSGFLGLRRSQSTEIFSNWFKDRLTYYCFDDVSQGNPRGLFVDQLWLNLVPFYFDDVSFLSHAGANVGHWNLHEKKLRLEDEKIMINDQPLIFFHFSGWDINNPWRLSRYSHLRDYSSCVEWNLISDSYKSSLLESEYTKTNVFPYAFEKFEDGAFISPEIRRFYYHKIMVENSISDDDPFQGCIHDPSGRRKIWTRTINYLTSRSLDLKQFSLSFKK